MYISTKTYDFTEGFSVCYRQHKADRKSGRPTRASYTTDEIPSCSALHGYALKFYMEFSCETLDARSWCVDFGSLGSFKDFLKSHFDHTMLVADDDPDKDVFINLHNMGIAKMVVVEATGCEALSKFLFDYLNDIWLKDNYPNSGIRCTKFQVFETPSNSAMYYE